MKKLVRSVIPLTFGLTASLAVAETCSEPADIELPDGATASVDEMVAGQAGVKQYVAGAEAFLACMDKAEKEAAEISDEEKLANVQRYNDMVDKMASVAESFNEQIRAYKAANPQ